MLLFLRNTSLLFWLILGVTKLPNTTAYQKSLPILSMVLFVSVKTFSCLINVDILKKKMKNHWVSSAQHTPVCHKSVSSPRQ